ncbi:MAG: putative glutathione S-transferase [Proteobacteria bacterium]|nr:putative glutathione S-transferase [Pseudomonadota bacterium]
MIDLYFWPTANGIKIPILLQELGILFRPFPLNIRTGEHKTEAFRKLNPNLKIPVIVDSEPVGGGAPVTVFESSAILVYLAEKYGQLLPANQQGRYTVLEWLFWHAAHVTSAFGQYQKFHEQIPEQVSDSLKQSALDEVTRLYQVLEARLAEADYLAGEYSIADIALYPWIQPRRQGQNLADYPHLARWYANVRARPAVERAYQYGLSLAPAEKSLIDWC